MSTHDIELPHSDEAAAHMLPSDLKKFEFGEHVAEAFSIAVGNPDETSQPLFTLDQVRAAIEADRKRMATVVESSWREGWAACRDSEYVGSEAEDSAYGDSEANRIALGLDQGESCGLEADRKRRGEPVKVPSDEEIRELSHEFSGMTYEDLDVVGFGRALLARYGKGTP